MHGRPLGRSGGPGGDVARLRSVGCRAGAVPELRRGRFNRKGEARMRFAFSVKSGGAYRRFRNAKKIAITLLKNHDLALVKQIIQRTKNGTKWHFFLGTTSCRQPPQRPRASARFNALYIACYGTDKPSCTENSPLSFATLFCHNKLKNVIKGTMVH